MAPQARLQRNTLPCSMYELLPGENPTHGPTPRNVTMHQRRGTNPTRAQHIDFKGYILMTAVVRTAPYTFAGIQPRQPSAPASVSHGAFATI
jgi:hypothetical protein